VSIIINHSDVAACPITSLSPRHYRETEDGIKCRCGEVTNNAAGWYFSLHWSNDYALYHAVLDHARELLHRVPTMTDQTLGRNLRDAVQRWCVDEVAAPLGWQEKAYVIDPAVLRMMRKEVEQAGGFSAVPEEPIAEEVRELLEGES
jgi:hypothetical protein